MRDSFIGLGYALALMFAFGAAYTSFIIMSEWAEWAWLALIHDTVIAQHAFDSNLSRDEAFGFGMITGLFVFVFAVRSRRVEGHWPHEK